MAAANLWRTLLCLAISISHARQCEPWRLHSAVAKGIAANAQRAATKFKCPMLLMATCDEETCSLQHDGEEVPSGCDIPRLSKGIHRQVDKIKRKVSSKLGCDGAEVAERLRCVLLNATDQSWDCSVAGPVVQSSEPAPHVGNTCSEAKLLGDLAAEVRAALTDCPNAHSALCPSVKSEIPCRVGGRNTTGSVMAKSAGCSAAAMDALRLRVRHGLQKASAHNCPTDKAVACERDASGSWSCSLAGSGPDRRPKKQPRSRPPPAATARGPKSEL